MKFCLKLLTQLCLLMCLYQTTETAPVSGLTFSKHAVLDPNGDFQLFWSYDNDTITMQYHAKTKGWAGLGFSPNGAMTGGDIALFWIDESGKGFVSDRHATKNGYPPEDKHQDYELLESTRNDSNIIMTFKRKRNTCDTEDWPLADDTTHVLYAANDNIPEDKNSFDKHTVRGSKSILFFDDRADSPDGVPPEPGATPLEFRVQNVKVPEDVDTLYYCEFMPLPKITSKKHVIKMEPIIQKDNVDVVHHFLLYICGTQNVSKYVGQGADCFNSDPELANAFGQCVSVFSAWAVGGKSIEYPSDIGIPLYNPNEDMYMMLQMHYDNSQFKKGKVDSSGVRLWLTDNLRPIDAGQAGFGMNVASTAQILPPGIQEMTNYGFCSAQCTKDLPQEGVKIIGGVLHTHLTGRKIRLLHYRNGIQLPNVFDDEYYDFNYQDYRLLKNQVSVLPGDELVVECTYNTVGRNTTTVGGLATHDEMCLVYVDYYPASYNTFACISQPDAVSLFTAFDGFDPQNPEKGIPKCANSSSLVDCIKNYPWTKNEAAKILELQRNAKHQAICLRQNFANNTKPIIDIYDEYGYVNFTTPFIPHDICMDTSTTTNIDTSMTTTSMDTSDMTTASIISSTTTTDTNTTLTTGPGGSASSSKFSGLLVFLTLFSYIYM